jgi:O-antigen/teichoic acid export membrane protein
MFLLTLVPESFMNAVYPNLSRAWREDKSRFVRLAERSLRYLVALALPAAVGAYVLAEPVVLLVYETDFARSVAVFSILIFGVVPIYMNNVFYRALFAAEQQLKSVIILVVNIAVLATACLLLIPRWGAVGAASALLISLGAAVAQNYIYTFALVYRSKLGGAALRTVAAAAAMGAAIWFVRPYLPWPLLMLVGPGLYVPLLFLLHALGREDVAAIKEILGFGRDRPSSPAGPGK